MTPIMLLVAIIVFTLIGCGFGIITGLIPGIHVNNVAHLVLVSQTVIISLATSAFGWAGPDAKDLIIIISSLIIGTVITHTFLDFIPSVFLGAPDGDTALSLLPGHRMMLAGRGYEAVKCSVTGSFGAMIFCLVLIIPLRLIIGEPVNAYASLEGFIHFVLICISAFLILGETAKAREEFNLNDIEMTGFIMSARLGVEKIAHDGMVLPDVSDIKKSCRGEKRMIAVQGTVDNVLATPENTTVVMSEKGGKIHVRLSGKNHFLPDVGERVTVVGNATARVTWKDHMLKRGMAFGIFLLSGMLGIVLLSPGGLLGHNFYILKLAGSDSGIVLLFPMFTGLFGLSTLLLSLRDKVAIPEQNVENVRVRVPLSGQFKSTMTGCIASVSSLFPGISSAIATMISVNLRGSRDAGGEGEEEASEFIISVSAVNTSVGIFNLLALFVIMKSRSGAMKAVEAIMGSEITPWSNIGNVPLELASLLLAALIAAITGIWLTLKFGKLFARNFSKINYQKMVWTVVLFLIGMITIFSGILGLAILAITTFMGFIPPLIGVKRVHLMGSLVLPVILYFL